MGTAELVAAVRFRSVRMSHIHRANDLAQGAEELRVVHVADRRIRFRG
jgi:hypothetical protein